MNKPRVLAMAVMALGAAPGWAQNLQDVVISASRAEQRSFDTPAAIEAVDRSTLQDAGPQVLLSESLVSVPGLTVLNRQHSAQDLQVSIRGFGARSAFGIRGIRLLVDGIPATTPDGQGQASSFGLASAERVEVLRGPLALLYGNSAGGVIQAFTREAPAEPEAIAQYYAGSYQMHRSDLQYAARLGEVGLVADYNTLDSNGYRSHSTTDRRQFNGKLSFGSASSTRVNLVFNSFDMPLAQDPLGLTAAQLAQDATQAGNNAIAARTRKITGQSQAGASVTHALDADRSLTARLYYGARDNLQYQAGNNWVGLNRGYYGAGLQYNAQTQLGERPMRWVAGYEYDYAKERRQGGAAAGGEKVPGSLTRDEDNSSQNSDLYAQTTVLAAERMSITAGARASTVRINSEDFFLGNGNGSGEVSYSATNPVLGLTWHAADALNLYANYGRGFETPTLVEVAYTTTGAPTFNPGINAARSQHYELGAKWVPAPRARVNLNLYQVSTTDEIVVAVSSGGSTAYTNAPGTTRTGVELGTVGELGAHLRARLSANAIDARFSQGFSNVINGTTYTVAADNKLPGIPQHFVYAELLWSAQTLESNSRLGSRAGVELVSAGRLYANDINTASADGYTVYNLKASHAWAVAAKGSFTTYVRLDNVTDQRYVGSVIVNQSASQFYEPAPGFNWSVGARLNLPL